MSRAPTAFKEEWLQKFEWLEKKDDYVGRCKFCCRDVNVSASGCSALNKHRLSQKHVSNTETRKQNKSLDNFLRSSSSLPASRAKSIDSTEAEIRWLCFLVEHNVAFRASDHFKVIRKISPDSESAKSLTCGRTKATYLLKHGVDVCLFKRLLDKLRQEDRFFSLLLDESNETGSRKFLVILVRYYDDSKMKVVTEIYRLPQLEDGKASTLEDILCDFLKQDELSTEKLLTIMTDSPAVMTGTKTGFLKRMRDHCPHLLDLGRCTLHHMSNAVNYAAEQLGGNAEELIDDLYHYFLYTSRWTSYNRVQELMEIEEHRLLRRVETRWLQLLPVVERVIEQLPALRHYFAEVLPKERPHDLKVKRNSELQKSIAEKSSELDLLFLQNVLPTVNRFEMMYQGSKPLIHSLYKSLIYLYTTLLTKFIKTEVIEVNRRKIFKAPVDKDHQLRDKDLFIGTSTRLLLSSCNEAEKASFFSRVRRFYETLALKLLSYLPLSNKFLKNLQFLCPSRPTKVEKFVKQVTSVAIEMSTVIGASELDTLRNECRMWYLHRGHPLASDTTDISVEQYWHDCSTILEGGIQKFSTLSRLAKSCLTLPHGNNESERAFSDVAEMLTKKRNRLSAEVIESSLRLKVTMRNSSSVCHDFVIDDEMIAGGKKTRQQYAIHMKEQSEKTASEKQRKIDQCRDEEDQKRNEAIKKRVEMEAKENQLKEKEKAAEELLKSYQDAISQIKSDREQLRRSACDQDLDLPSSTRRRLK